MTDESRLKAWTGPQQSDLASEHIDVDTLTHHVAGKLSTPVARLVTEHLAVCDDGRCVEFVRSLGAEVDASSGARYREDAPSPRTRPRTFQAREAVWAQFEAIARDRNVSTDELVSEAMAAYARVRGYDVSSEPVATARGDRESLDETRDGPVATALDRSYEPNTGGPIDEDDLARTQGPAAARLITARASFVETTQSRTSGSQGGPPPSPSNRVVSSKRPPVVPPPPDRRVPPPQPPTGRVSSRSSSVPSVRPPPARPQAAAPSGNYRPTDSSSFTPPSSSRAKQLVLNYRGQAQAVEKDRFLLGRSKNQADLRLDDPNVSRQHAVIERVGAAWYIVDLGSTNGVHVAGERVARRALSDGDVIVITTHEIHCSLR
jgi:hypothetical protein